MGSTESQGSGGLIAWSKKAAGLSRNSFLRWAKGNRELSITFRGESLAGKKNWLVDPEK